VSILWLTASENQMLRGASIFFTGIFSTFIFRKQLGLKRWGGIAIVMLGLVVVGISGLVRSAYASKNDDANTATTGQVLAGFLLVILSAALNSVQGVFEEKLLKGTSLEPLEVVGWEGLFGCLLSGFVLLPIAQAAPGSDTGGVFESTTDTLVQVTMNPGVFFTCLGYAVALAVMNNYSQVINKNLSAVHRMLLSTCRVILVWSVGLFINYAVTGATGQYGESWDVYSWIQLAGFALLVGGTLFYAKAAEDAKKAESMTPPINTEP